MTVEPIRSRKKIKKLIAHLENNYTRRDALLFRTGINTILRVGDLLRLRYCDIFDENGRFRRYLVLHEKKTSKEKKIALNPKIRAKIKEYVEYYELDSDDHLFFSYQDPTRPIDRIRAWRILKKAATECGIENLGTHSMRKTLAYHIYNETKNIVLVMHLLNHQSSKQTLKYIGVTQDQMDNVYKDTKFQF